MRKKQSTRGNIASQKQHEKRNKSNRQFNKPGINNASGEKTKRDKVELWAEREKKKLQHQTDILKRCRDLKVICRKIDKLEREKQKLINIIIKDVPKRKRK